MKKTHIALPVLAGLLLAACGQKQDAAEQPVANDPVADNVACVAAPVADVKTVEIVAGLSSKTLVSGCGDVAANGHMAVVHYTGWLYDAESENNRGSKFDSSHDRNQHFKFPLGGGRVIKGWDQGVAGMLIGEVRELTIAPEMAYGNRNSGPIPPGSTLVFEVELVDLQGSPVPPQTTGGT